MTTMEEKGRGVGGGGEGDRARSVEEGTERTEGGGDR